MRTRPPIQGYYNRDNNYYSEYHRQTKTVPDFQGWLDRWVRGVKDRRGYLEQFGAERLEGLKVRKRALAARTDFGH